MEADTTQNEAASTRGPKNTFRRWLVVTAVNITIVSSFVVWLAWPYVQAPLYAHLYCDDSTCHPLPRMLRDISFDMSPRELDAKFESNSRCIHQAVRSFLGRSCVVHSQIGPHPARCTVEFGLGDRASRITCELHRVALKDFEDHKRVEEQFLTTLIRKYGPAEDNYAKEHDFFATNEVVHYHQSWQWKDDRTTLLLCSEFTEFASLKSRIGVTIVSREHEARFGRISKNHEHKTVRHDKRRPLPGRRRIPSPGPLIDDL